MSSEVSSHINDISSIFPNIERARFNENGNATYYISEPTSLAIRVTSIVTVALLFGAVAFLCAHFGEGATWVGVGTICTGVASAGISGSLLTMAVYKNYRRNHEERKELESEEARWNAQPPAVKLNYSQRIKVYKLEQADIAQKKADEKDCAWSYV